LKFIAPLLFLALSMGSVACRTDNAPGENSGLRSELDAALKAELDTAPFTLSVKVHAPAKFVENSSYLARNVNFKPIDRLKVAVSARTGAKLKSRGEAHITVFTPSEFAALTKVLDKKEINELAVAGNIQATEFSTVCVGSGSLNKAGKIDRTFFVVVQSPALITLRQSILDSFTAKAGAKPPFEAAQYHPHITIGYTRVDLHEEQGVVKDEKSCVASLEELN
jgi:2'-5' RNA ligase